MPFKERRGASPQTKNMKNINISLLVLANMVANGRAFKVVRVPDWCGNYSVHVRDYEYQPVEYEYVEWAGTPLAFAKENPVFEEHCEPRHSCAVDIIVTGEELLRRVLNTAF